MNLTNTKYIVITLVLCSLCFGVGFYWGVNTTIDFGIDVILKLIEHQKMEVTIDEQMLKTGIAQWKDHIGGCLFMDAPVFPN